MESKVEKIIESRKLLEKKLDRIVRKESDAILFSDMEYCKKRMNEALLSGDQGEFLKVIRSTVMARGGMAELAKKTGLTREGLYRILCDEGNPSLEVLWNILDALGLQIARFDNKTGERKV